MVGCVTGRAASGWVRPGAGAALAAAGTTRRARSRGVNDTFVGAPAVCLDTETETEGTVRTEPRKKKKIMKNATPRAPTHAPRHSTHVRPYRWGMDGRRGRPLRSTTVAPPAPSTPHAINNCTHTRAGAPLLRGMYTRVCCRDARKKGTRKKQRRKAPASPIRHAAPVHVAATPPQRRRRPPPDRPPPPPGRTPPM